ncbi:hypothetical protein BDZ89DRAFT_1144905 [Hymenopellis radicata]|nr:hypothetical protein BDZ89DRAFT_1144905 [Hymenopellis radicata]
MPPKKKSSCGRKPTKPPAPPANTNRQLAYHDLFPLTVEQLQALGKKIKFPLTPFQCKQTTVSQWVKHRDANDKLQIDWSVVWKLVHRGMTGGGALEQAVADLVRLHDMVIPDDVIAVCLQKEQEYAAGPTNSQAVMAAPDNAASAVAEDVARAAQPSNSQAVMDAPDNAASAVAEDVARAAQPSNSQGVMDAPDNAASAVAEDVARAAQPSNSQGVMDAPDNAASTVPEDVARAAQPSNSQAVMEAPDNAASAVPEDVARAAQPSNSQAVMEAADNAASAVPEDVPPHFNGLPLQGQVNLQQAPDLRFVRLADMVFQHAHLDRNLGPSNPPFIQNVQLQPYHSSPRLGDYQYRPASLNEFPTVTHDEDGEPIKSPASIAKLPAFDLERKHHDCPEEGAVRCYTNQFSAVNQLGDA